MALPDSYSNKPNSIPKYFDAILQAQPPERFTPKFLDGLDFKSTNDRLIISVLKDLGFLDANGVPTQRYYDFLDESQSKYILADGVREAFSDLFNVNKDAQNLSIDEVKNKLKTLYKGKKTERVIKEVSRTFVALCEYADFSKKKETTKKKDVGKPAVETGKESITTKLDKIDTSGSTISLDSLQYHINIVLPESRDQAVYDAIFKSLKDHLG